MKSKRDPMMAMAKESVVAAYREKSSALDWHVRLITLEANGANPVFTLEMLPIECASYGESALEIRADVFCPMGADGGIIRLIERMSGQRASVYVGGFEKFLTDYYRGQDACHKPMAYRVIAERLSVQTYRKFNKAA